jgi:hypothetical protein
LHHRAQQQVFVVCRWQMIAQLLVDFFYAQAQPAFCQYPQRQVLRVLLQAENTASVSC